MPETIRTERRLFRSVVRFNFAEAQRGDEENLQDKSPTAAATAPGTIRVLPSIGPRRESREAAVRLSHNQFPHSRSPCTSPSGLPFPSRKTSSHGERRW